MDIGKVCRGCLEFGDVDDMKDHNIGGINIISIYEELTKTKLDTTKIQANMCPDCIQQLSKAYQFIESLQLSNKLLGKAMQEIEELQIIKIEDTDDYNHKKMKILEDMVKGKSKFTDLINTGNLETKMFIKMEDKTVDDLFSDNYDVLDNFVDHKGSSSSDDEIPLAERFVDELEAPFRVKEVKEINKLMNNNNADVEDRKRRYSKSSKDQFYCNKCDEGFQTYEEVESHLKLKHDSESKCILCNRECLNSFSLLYHMMVKHGKLVCCRLCLVSFKNKDELYRHYKSEEHNTKCTVCGEQFRKRKTLYEHRRKKHLNPQLEKEKYKCSECPKEFATDYGLKRHILVGHNDMRYLCNTCGQSYTTKRCLLLHVQKIHKGEQLIAENPKKNFFCEECGWKLKIYHKYTIAVHLARHKGHNFVCRKCYETFELEDEFKKHLGDLGHELYECNKCKSQFMTEENYQKHLQNHDVPKDKVEFKCKYCPKVFYKKQRLETHERVHTNERPYKCQTCGKGFKTWIHRKTHMDIHLDIKKYTCQYCSKAFTNSNTLKGHEMIHTGERPHKCSECDKGFIGLSDLKRHMKIHFRIGGKKGNLVIKHEKEDKTDNEVDPSNPIKKEEDDIKADSEVKLETTFVCEYGQITTCFVKEELKAEAYLEGENV